MRMLAATLAVLAMAQPALAATSLCVDTASTGFDWANEEWQPTKFLAGQHLIKEVGPDDPLGLICYSGLEGEGLWTDGQETPAFGASWGCFAWAEVGTAFSAYDTTRCRKFNVSATEVGAVDCTYAGTIRFQYQPSGEIVTTRTYSALMPPSATGSRDSLAITVGKCTVIEP